GKIGSVETPPPAWGRLDNKKVRKGYPGNTPTCVGKTFSMKGSHGQPQKHPHLRGEDSAHLQ
ncbi:hypothetical protein D6V12_18790, partial [Vibrio cholerae]|nr:hypothetical protein [Vibrio cholerae]